MFRFKKSITCPDGIPDHNPNLVPKRGGALEADDWSNYEDYYDEDY